MYFKYHPVHGSVQIRFFKYRSLISIPIRIFCGFDFRFGTSFLDRFRFDYSFGIFCPNLGIWLNYLKLGDLVSISQSSDLYNIIIIHHNPFLAKIITTSALCLRSFGILFSRFFNFITLLKKNNQSISISEPYAESMLFKFTRWW